MVCQAYEDMLEFNRMNPEIKEVYKNLQIANAKKGIKDGVFDTCMMELKYEFFTDKLYQIKAALLQKRPLVKDMQNVIRQYAFAFCTEARIYSNWRNTLSVYKVDSDIYQQVTTSKIPEDTPISIYERLPEWCVYVQLPEDNDFCENGLGFNGQKMEGARGFWAFFDYEDTRKINRTLNICIDPINCEHLSLDGRKVLNPFTLLLDGGDTVEHSVRYFFTQLLPQAEDDMQRISDSEWQAMSDEERQVIEQSYSHDKQLALKALSILLWLCAEEPDITNVQGEPVTGEQLRLPNYAVHKKTGVFIPPSNPIVYNLGSRLGAEVRTFNKKAGASGAPRAPSRKRPHIRRGHWHGVWSGTGQNKKFSVYWQPAVFVNAGG